MRNETGAVCRSDSFTVWQTKIEKHWSPREMCPKHLEVRAGTGNRSETVGRANRTYTARYVKFWKSNSIKSVCSTLPSIGRAAMLVVPSYQCRNTMTTAEPMATASHRSELILFSFANHDICIARIRLINWCVKFSYRLFDASFSVLRLSQRFLPFSLISVVVSIACCAPVLIMNARLSRLGGLNVIIVLVWEYTRTLVC